MSLPSTGRPLALNPSATAHQLAPPSRIASPVPLGAAQQSHQLAPFPLASYLLASPAPSALPALSSNFAERPQSELLLAPLALPQLSVASLPSHLQYVLQYSQSAPRVARTVMVPAALQPGTTSALYSPAPLLPEAAAMQPALQGGPPFVMGAQFSQVGAQFAMCAQPLQAGTPLAISAQPSQGGAQYAVSAQQVAQVGAPFAVCAQLATPAGAQPGALAADWEKKDANALLKLESRARFCESAGYKIKGCVADLELYLRMCAHPVHHWWYSLMASVGAEETEKVRRSHLADAITDYAKFKSGVEALFSKFEFKGSFRAQLRTHA